MVSASALRPFQSPRGDFGFLKVVRRGACRGGEVIAFQSPRGDFGFLKQQSLSLSLHHNLFVFNPLAGILVF